MSVAFRRLALLFVGSLVASCDPPYEPPCRVARQDVVASDRAIGARNAVDLHRAPRRIHASWPQRELPDAGAADPLPSLTAFRLVELDERGTVLRTTDVATPPELRARKGSIDAAGVVPEEGATLVYWIETTTSTDPDGRVRTAYATKATYGAAPIVAPARGACEKCRLRAAIASLGSESVAIVRTESDLPPATLGGPPAAPAFVALVFRRDGSVTVREVPWLALPPPLAALDAGLAAGPAEQELSLEIDGEGRLVLVTDGQAWLLDRSLTPLAGPIALPGADAKVAFAAPIEASLAWTAVASEATRGTFARRDVFAGAAQAPMRVTRGRAVLAADRRGDEIGVVFESAGRTLFAALDAHARKRGGDVLVRDAADPDRASEYGTYAPTDASLLVANGGGRFTSVTLGSGSLSVAEVVCAP